MILIWIKSERNWNCGKERGKIEKQHESWNKMVNTYNIKYEAVRINNYLGV